MMLVSYLSFKLHLVKGFGRTQWESYFDLNQLNETQFGKSEFFSVCLSAERGDGR